MRNAQPTAIESMRAARQERLQSPASPEDVAVLHSILMDLGPAEQCALRDYYVNGLNGPEAAAKNGLTAEAFCLIRATTRGAFFVLTGRAAR